MHDATRNPIVETDLAADPACCPSGACGPLFETPLLELAFHRMRDAVKRRVAPPTADPTPTDLLLAQPHPRKDAPR